MADAWVTERLARYADPDTWSPVAEAVHDAVVDTLLSRRWGLAGPPDYLYVVGWRGGEWAKVGRSRAVGTRVHTCQVGCPHRLEVAYWLHINSEFSGRPVGPVASLERAIHRALIGAGAVRGTGGVEWFNVDPWSLYAPIDRAYLACREEMEAACYG